MSHLSFAGISAHLFIKVFIVQSDMLEIAHHIDCTFRFAPNVPYVVEVGIFLWLNVSDIILLEKPANNVKLLISAAA